MFEYKVNENQKETLWKIQDCEELLKSRISERKVQDMVDKIDKKVNADLKD